MRRVYKHCKYCKGLVLVSGEPKEGDVKCPHRFSRAPMTNVVYYVNKAGEMWVPPSPDERCPFKNYERREVQPHEIRRFEREQNLRLKAEYEEIDASERSPEADRQRAEIRELLRQDVIRESQGWDSEHRELLDYILNETREMPDYSRRNYDPEFHISAFN